MATLLQILAMLLAGAAGFLYWKGNYDAALAAFVFACLVFLLNTRLNAANNNRARETERLLTAETEEAEQSDDESKTAAI